MQAYNCKAAPKRQPTNTPLPHGTLLSCSIVNNEQPSFVVLTAVVVLDTSKDLLQKIKDWVLKEVNSVGFYGSGRKILASTWEEVAIAETTCSLGMDWTHISPRYEMVPRKPSWLNEKSFEDLVKREDIAAYHMLGSKPLVEGRGQWPDLEIWWSAADQLLTNHPGLAEYFKPPPAAVSQPKASHK